MHHLHKMDSFITSVLVIIMQKKPHIRFFRHTAGIPPLYNLFLTD